MAFAVMTVIDHASHEPRPGSEALKAAFLRADDILWWNSFSYVGSFTTNLLFITTPHSLRALSVTALNRRSKRLPLTYFFALAMKAKRLSTDPDVLGWSTMCWAFSVSELDSSGSAKLLSRHSHVSVEWTPLGTTAFN